MLIDASTFEEMLAEINLLPRRPIDVFEPPALLTKRRCETTGGVPVDPHLAVKIALEGHVRRVVCNSAGAVIDYGHRQRLFRGAARAAVMLQSPRCIHPGCRVRVGNCEADHLIEHSRGGPTRPDNGGPLCKRHNLRKNQGYRAHRDGQGRWHTYRPDGSEIC